MSVIEYMQLIPDKSIEAHETLQGIWRNGVSVGKEVKKNSEIWLYFYGEVFLEEKRKGNYITENEHKYYSFVQKCAQPNSLVAQRMEAISRTAHVNESGNWVHLKYF